MTEQAERTYFIDPHGHPRYSDTRRFVRRELLPALREVDPPDPPPAPSRPAPAAEPAPPPEPGPAAPAEKSRWMDDALPAPELPWRPAEAPAADSIGDAIRRAAEEGAEAAEAEPGLRPLFEEAVPAEAPAGPAPDFAGKHDEDCPYSVAAQRCGCGAEYLATTEAEGQMLAGATARAIDAVIGRALKKPIVPRAIMGDPRILEAVGISADEWAMVEAAESEAWRRVAAKYGSGIGPYAVEIGLAVAIFGGTTLRMRAGVELERRHAAEVHPAPAEEAAE